MLFIQSGVLCGKYYIGETGRMVKTRMYEHISTANSNVYQHFTSEHGGRTPQFKWNVIHRNLRHWKQRKEVESIYIEKYQSDHILINAIS